MIATVANFHPVSLLGVGLFSFLLYARRLTGATPSTKFHLRFKLLSRSPHYVRRGCAAGEVISYIFLLREGDRLWSMYVTGW